MYVFLLDYERNVGLKVGYHHVCALYLGQKQPTAMFSKTVLFRDYVWSRIIKKKTQHENTHTQGF